MADLAWAHLQSRVSKNPAYVYYFDHRFVAARGRPQEELESAPWGHF